MGGGKGEEKEEGRKTRFKKRSTNECESILGFSWCSSTTSLTHRSLTKHKGKIVLI